ncbi:MAG: hypothetical protein A3D31_03590 [Candidatus Fluviicola riflensis]|nr:MAG: hypothetical protein CHH17_11440 [Candidatus Fluviicola riflensis]OGS79061.1 MAG: hypothetical protein A3D31_03590 [Candidatus Fluviicola riflensis]OGS86084.1 MAG: hypothetical protein A3E30_11080 [Fluviicola sp. RIFCSPHIGHO2_12_FULL_43_24]OGS86493.1 MAG: hypothetical protein A2724_03050 [Fluviicola sp. RIFCSPHIGHO2_01_FULL_43_53]
MTKSILLSCFLLTGSSVFSQDTIKTLKKSDLEKPNDFSSEKKWGYFQLETMITVKIIEHLPAFAECGVLATASMTIAETEKGDTIRILDLCNTLDIYKPGQIINVSPADKPPFGVSTPFTLKENPVTKELEPSEFDVKVVKTAWGNLLME